MTKLSLALVVFLANIYVAIAQVSPRHDVLLPIPFARAKPKGTLKLQTVFAECRQLTGAKKLAKKSFKYKMVPSKQQGKCFVRCVINKYHQFPKKAQRYLDRFLKKTKFEQRFKSLKCPTINSTPAKPQPKKAKEEPKPRPSTTDDFENSTEPESVEGNGVDIDYNDIFGDRGDADELAAPHDDEDNEEGTNDASHQNEQHNDNYEEEPNHEEGTNDASHQNEQHNDNYEEQPDHKVILPPSPSIEVSLDRNVSDTQEEEQEEQRQEQETEESHDTEGPK